MLILTSAQTVRIVTASATSIAGHYSYVDINASTGAFVGASADVITPITTATTTTLVSSPSSGNVRNVKSITIENNHASSNALTVDIYDGVDEVDSLNTTLLSGEVAIFDENGQWIVYGADGLPKPNTLANSQQINIVSTADQAVSDTDTVKIFARKRAGIAKPRFISPYGIEESFQETISEKGFSAYLPNNGTTVGLNYGIAWTTGGTVSHPTPSSTSPAIYNQQKRTRFANVVTTQNQFLGIRTAAAEKRYWRGNAAGLGGLWFHTRFAIGLWPAATVRLFVGVNDSTSGWVISDTLTGNGCGFWHDTTDAASVLSFVTRDGTTATKAAITLAANLAAGQAFDCWIYSPPNGSFIAYALRELNTNTMLVDTVTTTTLPLNTAFLGQEIAMSNGTVNTTVTTTAIEISGHSCISNY